MADSLNQVRITVADVGDAEAAKAALRKGIALQIEEAGTDPVKLKAIEDELNASSRALATAVHANIATKREKEAVEAARKKAAEEQAALDAELAERAKAEEADVVAVRALATKLHEAGTDPAKLEALTAELLGGHAKAAPAPHK